MSVPGDFADGAQPLTKGTGGVWTATAGPLRPAPYNYTFSVDDVRVADPTNPMTAPDARSAGLSFGEMNRAIIAVANGSPAAGPQTLSSAAMRTRRAAGIA